MLANPDPVVILSAARTPLGRFMGELSPLSAHRLGAGPAREDPVQSAWDAEDVGGRCRGTPRRPAVDNAGGDDPETFVYRVSGLGNGGR